DDLQVVTVFPKQLATSMKISFSAVSPDIAQLSEAAVGARLRRINNPTAQTVTRYRDYPLSPEPE
ncbi:LacI family transcriptional regulator, partial [Bifidobacterium pseudocatenulatum]|nr:LacI family transcriptional regulator [Bifidobacterium pseudocatenulatum]